MNKIIQQNQFSKSLSGLPWWKGACIYQIYPRSFKDTNGDGIGDLKGITEKLEYIASLGVDGIWISPFFTSPMKDFGYDVADFCGVDPMFGTLADFDELLEKAHLIGLKVIIDQVYSHTSDEHEWFKQSRLSKDNDKSDYYVWANAKPDGSPPNNWQSVFYGPSWTWDARRGQYYFHNFLPEQPDLNVHNPKVQEEILKVAHFWLARGVDGFRLDALNFLMHDPEFRDNPPKIEGIKTRPFDFQYQKYSMSHPDIPAFIEKLAGVINSYPNRFTVAEVGGAEAAVEMREFTKGDTRLNTAYGFVFLYADEITPKLVQDAVLGAQDFWVSWAFSNHDAPRCMSRWAKGRDEQAAARCFMALLAALRGNIFLYYGEELGLEQADIPFEQLQDPEAIKNYPLTLGRDGARSPMVWANNNEPNGGFSIGESWLPIDSRHFDKAAAGQESDADSMLNYTRKVMALRQSTPALLWGDINFTIVDENILVFEREYKGKTVICAFNLGFETINKQIAANAKILLKSNGASLEKLPPLGLLFLQV